MTYTKTKLYPVCCISCRQELTTNNLNRHYLSKNCCMNIKRIRSKNGIHPNIVNGKFTKVCEFCNLLTTSKRHETSCSKNPNRLTGTNHYTKAKETGIPYIMSDDSRAKRSASGRLRRHSEETKEQMRVSAAKRVEDFPESYRGHYNRGYVKEITCTNGFKVLGSWEESFVEFCIKEDIKIEQPNNTFSYDHEGLRAYFPDFYLPEHDAYVEVKGYKTDKDSAKWDAMKNDHDEKLLIIDKRSIFKIKDNKITFSELMNTYLH